MLTPGMHIHIVGFCDAVASSVAYILQKKGYVVSCCDSPQTQAHLQSYFATRLQELGCHCIFHSDLSHIDTIDLLIYADTVSTQHPEVIAAQKNKIPVSKSSIFLGILLQRFSTIMVSGSYGKTTTGAILYHLLQEDGAYPTTILKNYLPKHDYHTTYNGEDRIAIIGTQITKKSLSFYHPETVVITHIDEQNQLYSATLLQKTLFYGTVILNGDHAENRKLKSIVSSRCLTFGFKHKNVDIRGEVIHQTETETQVNIHTRQSGLCGTLEVPVTTQSDLEHALAAVATGFAYNVPFSTMIKAVRHFQGTRSPYSTHHTARNITVIEESNNHPGHIENVLVKSIMVNKSNIHLIIELPNTPDTSPHTSNTWWDRLQRLLGKYGNHLTSIHLIPAAYPSQQARYTPAFSLPDLAIYTYNEHHEIIDMLDVIVQPADTVIQFSKNISPYTMNLSKK